MSSFKVRDIVDIKDFSFLIATVGRLRLSCFLLGELLIEIKVLNFVQVVIDGVWSRLNSALNFRYNFIDYGSFKFGCFHLFGSSLKRVHSERLNFADLFSRLLGWFLAPISFLLGNLLALFFLAVALLAVPLRSITFSSISFSTVLAIVITILIIGIGCLLWLTGIVVRYLFKFIEVFICVEGGLIEEVVCLLLLQLDRWKRRILLLLLL